MSDQLEEPFGAWELFEELWEKFTATNSESSMNIKLCKSSDEVFKLVEHVMRNMLKESAYYDRLKLYADVKDNARAADARAMGNGLFHPKQKRYIEALKRYNEAIAFSEKGSEARALAYANRSAICYELQRYEECLYNIRLARESNYPARLADKLSKREKAAKEAMKTDLNNNKQSKEIGSSKAADGKGNALSLSYDANESVPQAADCLELRESKEFGRYVATTRNLRAGDVVMIEKPSFTLLLDKYRHTRCDFCHAERLFVLIPCESCTVAMYCSSVCMEQAHQRYHRYECAVLRDLWRTFTKIPVMALRTVTTAIAAFDHDLFAMKEHLEEMDESKVNGFSMDWKQATPKDVYDTVHVLITNQNIRDSKDLAHRIFFAHIIHDLLLKRSELGTVCEGHPEISWLLMELLLRHLQTTPANMHSLYYMDYQPSEGIFELTNYASACFPLLSMMNHSCAPNITRVTLRDGRCAIVITRPIPKDGQLYDNYGQHHCLMPIRQRRSKLLTQYKFLCKCEACENNYPQYADLPSIDASRYGLIDAPGIHADLVRHQPKIAAEVMPKLCQYLNDIGYQYPRYEVSSCQELFLRCFQIINMETSDIVQYWKYCSP